MGIELPKTDEVIPRHQFYATIAATVETNQRATSTIGGKLDTLTESYDTVHDVVSASETRNKTLISSAVLIWAIISGVVGWYVERTVLNFDKFISRFEDIEKKVTAWEPEINKNKDVQDKISAINRRMEDLQRQVYDLESGKKK